MATDHFFIATVILNGPLGPSLEQGRKGEATSSSYGFLVGPAAEPERCTLPAVPESLRETLSSFGAAATRVASYVTK